MKSMSDRVKINDNSTSFDQNNEKSDQKEYDIKAVIKGSTYAALNSKSNLVERWSKSFG